MTHAADAAPIYPDAVIRYADRLVEQYESLGVDHTTALRDAIIACEISAVPGADRLTIPGGLPLLTALLVLLRDRLVRATSVR